MIEDRTPHIRCEGITRRLGSVVANDGITLDIPPGTIHGLIGENGAGKTTLVRMLFGLDAPDAGRILLDDGEVRFRSPRDAMARGIGMVHQHFMLVGDLPALDNIMLGDEPGRGGVIDRSAARARLEARAGSMLEGLDLDLPVEALPVSLRQRVEILKLLYRDARFLILDEPTAVLSPGEIEALFRDLVALRDAGRTILLITHRLAEVMTYTDRVSVLRRGRLILTRDTAATTEEELATAVIGATAPPQAAWQEGSAAPGSATNPILEFHDVHAPAHSGTGGLRGLSLVLNAFEIAAVVGVEGNGQTELAEVASGRRPATAGRLVREGAALPPGRPLPSDPQRTGLIPEDRHRDGLVLTMSVAENLILGRQKEPRFRKGAALDAAAIAAHAERLIAAHDVRPPDAQHPAGSLSGGNQQKVVAARAMADSPGLIVAAHPTRGLDFHAARAVRSALIERARSGAAILWITQDLDEARAVGTRLLVLFGGRIAGELDPRAATDAELGLLMTGGAAR